MTGKHLTKVLAITLALGLSSSLAQAKATLNAMCYMNVDDSSKTITGANSEKEFELASTSKVVTSFWAINKLGAKYRFTTKIYITPVATDTYDVHIQGDKDPYFGQQMVYFLASELTKNGIKKIENLSFDENLKLNWNVAEPSYQSRRSYDPQPDAVQALFESAFVTGHINATNYNSLKNKVKSQTGVAMAAAPGVQVRRVKFVRSSDFKKESKTKSLLLRSAPLYQYLKFMTLHSNNYMADLLFNKLGGANAFSTFIKARLDMDKDDINFVNGSGDSVITSHGKLYNKASCGTMIKVLMAMRTDLDKQSLGLDDVMAVAGVDNSTLGGRYANLNSSVIAKTGTVDPAITLAGMLSTEKGDLVFAVLMKTAGPADWTSARNQIREKVGVIIKGHGGSRRFKYSPFSVLPVDKYSVLSPEVVSSKQ